MELKTIDFKKAKYFDCDGKTFYVQETCSFNRFKVFQKLALELGFSMTFMEIYKSVAQGYSDLNNSRPADCAVVLHNILGGVVSLEEKDNPSLRICALVMNEKGEDITQYDESQMQAKIDCWAKELDVLPFFIFAASLVEGWTTAYRNVSLLGFKREKKSPE